MTSLKFKLRILKPFYFAWNLNATQNNITNSDLIMCKFIVMKQFFDFNNSKFRITTCFGQLLNFV